MAAPKCLFCRQTFEVAELLGKLADYSTLTDSGAAPCPRCNKQIEFRVRSNELVLGYTYFGGSMHFESFETVRVPGLRQHRDGSTVTLELHGVLYPPRPTA